MSNTRMPAPPISRSLRIPGAITYSRRSIGFASAAVADRSPQTTPVTTSIVAAQDRIRKGCFDFIGASQIGERVSRTADGALTGMPLHCSKLDKLSRPVWYLSADVKSITFAPNAGGAWRDLSPSVRSPVRRVLQWDSLFGFAKGCVGPCC